MRYVIVDGSQSKHCCFDCTIVDTTKPVMLYGKPYIERETGQKYESVCECFNTDDAKMICNSLNAAILSANTNEVKK